METGQKEKIVEIFGNVIETMAFMFADYVEDLNSFETIDDAVMVKMDFHGQDGKGHIEITVPTDMCLMIASNVLGMDPDEPLAISKASDALKELLNVFTGRIVTELYGAKPVFDLSVPELFFLDSEEWTSYSHDENVIKFNIEDKPVLLKADIA